MIILFKAIGTGDKRIHVSLNGSEIPDKKVDNLRNQAREELFNGDNGLYFQLIEIVNGKIKRGKINHALEIDGTLLVNNEVIKQPRDLDNIHIEPIPIGRRR